MGRVQWGVRLATAVLCGVCCVGMAAEKHPPDAATDALAHYLKSRQLPDGHWQPISHRPPLESSAFSTRTKCSSISA